MKKLILLSGIVAVMLISCKKNEPTAPAPAPTPPPVENPAPPPAPEPRATTTTTTTTVEEKDGTSVNLSKDGVDIQNKKGDSENNIKLTTKKSEVEIKTN